MPKKTKKPIAPPLPDSELLPVLKHFENDLIKLLESYRHEPYAIGRLGVLEMHCWTEKARLYAWVSSKIGADFIAHGMKPKP